MILFLLLIFFLFIYIPVTLLHKYNIRKTRQGDSGTYNWKKNQSNTKQKETKQTGYLEVVSSKGKLYRRTFSENKKLYPVKPIFYDLIIDGGIPDIYIYNRF